MQCVLSTSAAATAAPFEYLQELELRIESLTNLGDGVARVTVDGVAGWVVMVGRVVPGELVKAKVYRNHNNYSEATLTEVLEPSPDRVTPQCALFGMCGGCQYQHMAVGAQREWKRQQVVDVLERIGGLRGVAVNAAVGSEHAYGYRSKITPHYEAPLRKAPGDVRSIGFQRLPFPTLFHDIDIETVDTQKILDVPQCPIAAARARVRDAAAAAFAAGRARFKSKGATLLLRHVKEGVVYDNKELVTEEVSGLTFKFTAGEFFQNNPYVLPSMVEHVLARARGDGDVKFLIDAYCGGGLFALCASRHFDACAGVEVSPAAVECATRNAQLNGIENCTFLQGTASAIFDSAQQLFDALSTAVIVDPPRKGCDEVFLAQLFAFAPRRVVYVSCDPATQARDAKDIVAAGYEITDVTPFDLFPQTRHIENVITFERRSGGDAEPL
ncbi:RNA methyltransferase, TrmA family [Tribonema minus]|uniref:RNA methyltransferase, TrmA family n=1 Tax=Tribonema minus TaxID=303371 RepID=A0A835YJC5_9STRA|nr:RNA methyltransferase, TrmA family [Tribonema minus]